MIWAVATSPRFRERYEDVAAWPLPRVIAANDLIDAFADFEADVAAQVRDE